MSSGAWTPRTITWSPSKRFRRQTTSPDSGRESYPCQYVCAECGWLADVDGDPCPGCRGVAWIDLSHVTTAQTLRAHERANPPLDPKQRRRLDVGLAALFVAWTTAGVVLAAATLPVLGSTMALATGVLLVRRVRESVIDTLSRRARAEVPARRRLALPPATGVAGRIRGRATPESTLRSPIEGVPCLAWRVRAMLRDSVSSDLMIDDGRSAAFELGGQHFDAGAVELPDGAEVIELSELDASARERAVRFLRARGCFSHEGEWLLEERCIPLGRPVAVEGRGDQAAPLLRRDDDATVSPYR